MRSSETILLALALALLPFASGCGSSNAPAPAAVLTPAAPMPAAPVATWTLVAADSDLLGDKVELRGFEFRPPKDFTSVRVEEPLYFWSGPPMGDSRHSIMLSFTDDQAGDEDLPLDELVESVVKEMHANDSSWIISPSQRGSINGHPFIRLIYQQPARGAAAEQWGVIHMALFDKLAVSLVIQTVGPRVDEEACERSLATFRQRATLEK